MKSSMLQGVSESIKPLTLKEKTEQYIFDYDTDYGSIKITFVNGKFKTAFIPFSGTYTRGQWKVLSEIEKEITRIEKEMRECK